MTLLAPFVDAMEGDHINRYVWSRVIVPSDLVRLFGAISVNYRYGVVIHCAITLVRA